MKKARILFFLLCVYGVVQAQNPQKVIDSLQNVLQNARLDTIKVLALERLSWEHKFANPVKAIEYGKQSVDLANKIKFEKGMMLATNTLGIAYAIQNNLPKALTYFLQSVKLCEKLNQPERMANAYSNIAGVYELQKEYEKSLNALKKVLEIDLKLKNEKNLWATYQNMTVLSRHLGKYDQALEYAFKGVELGLKTDVEANIGGLYHNIGYVYFFKKNYSESLKYYEKALNSFAQSGEELRKAITRNAMAQLYLAQNQPNKALELANQALTIASPSKAMGEIQKIYETLFQIYQKEKNYEKAFQYHQLYTHIKDSLYNQEKEKIIQEMNVRFETHQKEQEIESLKKESELQRQLKNWAFLGFGLMSLAVILLVIVGYLYYNRFKLRHQIVQQQKDLLETAHQKTLAEQRLSEEETRRLQAEIEHKNRELSSTAMYMYQKNEMLSDIQEKLESLSKHVIKDSQASLQAIQKMINESMNLDEEWEKFKLHFDNVHPDFFNALQVKYSDLTQNELKLCAYIRMNLANKEIARLLNVNFRSVQVAKYRLKKKINLSEEDSLSEFIQVV